MTFIRGKTDSIIILTALGVDVEGNKDVLALRACAEEDKDGWSCLIQDLRTRGVAGVDLIVTDGHDGLLAAVSSLFTATPRQRCLVHKLRNVMNAFPTGSGRRWQQNWQESSRPSKKKMPCSIWRPSRPNTRSAIPKLFAA